MALERTARNLGVNLIRLPLKMGETGKEWINPHTKKLGLVEDAVLGYFQNEGWRGYSKEGGLILNLIKAMSFPEIDIRNRSTYTEALYAQNVAFEDNKFEVEWLLNNLRKANKNQIVKNFRIMSSKETYTWSFAKDCSSSSSTSMLDYFPSLEEWMFVELFNVLGVEKILKIAEKFSSNPYMYRAGWPDLTIWKSGEIKFFEVKSPGDRLHQSQRTIINEFIKPLDLDFALIDVHCG